MTAITPTPFHGHRTRSKTALERDNSLTTVDHIILRIWSGEYFRLAYQSWKGGTPGYQRRENSCDIDGSRLICWPWSRPPLCLPVLYRFSCEISICWHAGWHLVVHGYHQCKDNSPCPDSEESAVPLFQSNYDNLGYSPWKAGHPGFQSTQKISDIHQLYRYIWFAFLRRTSIPKLILLQTSSMCSSGLEPNRSRVVLVKLP